MTDLDLHHELDLLAAGRASQPDLPAIMAGGRRRRRRTRAIWVAAGLSTAAVVAPLALLVGGGAATAPETQGFAAGTAAASTDDIRLESMQAAVVEAFPNAANADVETSPGESPEDRWLYFTGMDGVRLGVGSATAGYRTACNASCPQVGDRTVAVLHGGPIKTAGEDEWHISVQVYPTDPSRSEKVEVTALVNAASQAEAEALLPSVETLTDLALDERLVPPAL